LGLLGILEAQILKCSSQEDLLTMMKPKGGILEADADGREIDGQYLMQVMMENTQTLPWFR